MKSKPVKIILAVLAGIALSISVLMLYLGYQLELKKTTIAVYNNEESTLKILFQEIGESFTFGPSKVEIVLEDETGKVLDSVTTRIYNDGSNLDEGNLTVTWTDSGVQIAIHGDEQKDEIHQLYYLLP